MVRNAISAGVDRRPAVGALSAPLGVLLLAAALAVAFAIRLMQLDWLPLDAQEAAASLPAYSLAQGIGPANVAGPPLVFHLQTLVFWLFGGGDVQARFVCALAGVGLVAAGSTLRRPLGIGAAVALCGLLALHPLWVYSGRNVCGGTVAALTLVASIGLWYGQTGRAAVLFPIAAAAVLAAGGPGVPFVLALLVAAGMVLWRGESERAEAAVAARWPMASDRRRAAALFAVALALAVTAAALRPDGLAALASQPGAWLVQLAWGAGLAWRGFLLPLVAYGPDLLVFGLVGVVLGARSGQPLQRFIAIWASTALLLGALFGTPPFVLHAILPLTLAAAMGLGRLVEAVAERARWAEDGVMTAILVIVLIYGLLQLAAFANANDQALGLSMSSLALGSVMLAALLACVYLLLWGPEVAGRVVGLTLLMGLSALAWANGSDLCFRPGAAMREPMRPSYTAPGAETLARSVASASWAHVRDPNAWSAAADPALRDYIGWPLREREVRWIEPAGQLDEPVVVTLSGSSPSFGPKPYRGQTHTVAGRWEPAFGDWHGFVRWWLQRKSAANAPGPENTQADLYIIAE